MAWMLSCQEAWVKPLHEYSRDGKYDKSEEDGEVWVKPLHECPRDKESDESEKDEEQPPIAGHDDLSRRQTLDRCELFLR
jgi:hypothetical protein